MAQKRGSPVESQENRGQSGRSRVLGFRLGRAARILSCGEADNSARRWVYAKKRERCMMGGARKIEGAVGKELKRKKVGRRLAGSIYTTPKRRLARAHTFPDLSSVRLVGELLESNSSHDSPSSSRTAQNFDSSRLVDSASLITCK
jgi:hypothetical protein